MNEITQEQVDAVARKLFAKGVLYSMPWEDYCTMVRSENPWTEIAHWHLTQMAAIQEKLAAVEKGRDEWKSNCADAVHSVLEARDMLDPGGNLSAREAAQNLRCDVADMRIKLEESEAAASVMREALSHYAQCSDGCTCDDGWNHTAVEQALSQTAGKDLLEKVGRIKTSLNEMIGLAARMHNETGCTFDSCLANKQIESARQTLKEL